MKVHNVGGLKNFTRAFDMIVKNGNDFTVKSGGASKRIEFDSGKRGMTFSDSKIKGAFLCGMVRADINRYIEENGVPPVFNKIYNLTKFNTELIAKNIKSPVTAIDINYCYFQTAYNLGYISKKTFDRGTISKDIKEGVLASIGSLNKLEMVETYRSGKLIEKKVDFDKYNRYSPFYWNIINKVWVMMEDFFEAFPENSYMWLTDCCYVDTHIIKKALKFIHDRGYKTKTFMIDFQNVDNIKQTVHWFDCKDSKNKSIFYRYSDVI